MFNFMTGTYTEIKLALKNIFRNRRHSAITLGMIVIGTTALVLLGGYVKIMDIGLKNAAINNEFGHLQIAKKGYFDGESNSTELMMDGEEVRSLEEYLSGLPEVDSLNKRNIIAGMAGTMKHSTFFSAVCGDPFAESLMMPSLLKGNPLSPDDPYGVVVGREMAKKLKVDVGDPMVLLFANGEGAQEAVSVKLSGIYKGLMKEQESVVMYIPIGTSWDLMLEKKVHRVLVFLKEMKELEAAAEKIRNHLEQAHPGLELRTWDQLAAYYKQIVGMIGSMIAFGGAIVFFVIVFGISNTMYMVVNERTKEIGTMRAFGVRRTEILGSFLLEGLLLGLIGAAVGILLSALVIPAVNSLKLTLPPGPGQDEPIPVALLFDWATALSVTAVCMGTALLASVLPAYRAARKNITEALRRM